MPRNLQCAFVSSCFVFVLCEYRCVVCLLTAVCVCGRFLLNIVHSLRYMHERMDLTYTKHDKIIRSFLAFLKIKHTWSSL
jgi:hypothetical protein